jgi:hypothetical protein
MLSPGESSAEKRAHGEWSTHEEPVNSGCTLLGRRKKNKNKTTSTPLDGTNQLSLLRRPSPGFALKRPEPGCRDSARNSDGGMLAPLTPLSDLGSRLLRVAGHVSSQRQRRNANSEIPLNCAIRLGGGGTGTEVQSGARTTPHFPKRDQPEADLHASIGGRILDR